MHTLKRLAMIADMVIKGQPVADIGADHAWLPIYLIENQITDRVIIGELGDGPYMRSFNALMASSAQNNIDLRQGNGLQILAYGEVKSVVIAGMGGDTIVEILAYDWDKAASFQRFIFQPMTKAQVLRQQLAGRGWIIEEERLVFENRRFFQIIVSRPANNPYRLTDLELEIGTDNLKADDDLKKEFIMTILRKYRRINDELLKSDPYQNRLLVEDNTRKIKQLEAILDASQSKRCR